MTLIFRPDTRVRAHKVKVVDEDDLLAYLSALRPFLLNDDAVFLDRALKVAAAHVTDPKMQSHIDAIRTQWSAAQKDRSMQYVVGEEELTPRDVFLLYVNARFFHVPDPEAIELLRRVDDPALPPFGPYMLMEFAITTHNTVAAAARVFNAAVAQRPGMSPGRRSSSFRRANA